MSMIKRFTAALVTVAAVSTAGALMAGPASAQDRTFGACAELEMTIYRFAKVGNDCDVPIQGTVVLTDGTTMPCLWIPPHVSRGFFWDRPVQADYAKDCPRE
ncbi:unnamed protein product [[Actinomadura] parvosata subsp. kistnae]|uniref:hypothetical protein n=1 Tax=[Actinomadura] parvosata TaxID=1955412 RepID=UPI000D2B58B7|nr:unnamed protein product [Actinomadura parvosata subsp. kistnae]